VLHAWEEKGENNYKKVAGVLKMHYHQTSKAADFNEEIIGKKNAVPGVAKTIAWGKNTVGKKGILLESLGLSLYEYVYNNEVAPMHPDLVFILWKEMAETFKSLHLEQGLEHGDVALRNLLERNPAVDGTNKDRLFYVIDFDMAKPATRLGIVLDLFNLLRAGCRANGGTTCPPQLWSNDESTGVYTKNGNGRVNIASQRLGDLLGNQYCKFLGNLLQSEGYLCENLVSMLKSNELITDFPQKKEKLTDDLKKKFGVVITGWLSSIDKLITLKSIDKEKEWKDYLQSSKNVDKGDEKEEENTKMGPTGGKEGRQPQSMPTRLRKSDEIKASNQGRRGQSTR